MSGARIRIRFYLSALATAVVTYGLLAAPAVHGTARSTEWREIKDPHFGEVLYNFYQQKYFSAITNLMVAEHFQRVAHHQDEAELLRGGLLLSYGLHLEAGRIFQRLIDAGAPPDVRDRAWFYLAKIRYQRGYLTEAEDALTRIKVGLPGELEEERVVLHAYLLMRQQRYPEAVAILSQVRGQSEWVTYARYNLGVALIKNGQRESGVTLLEEVGRMPAANEEMKSLRDKANVALGYAFLREQTPVQAKSYLQRVRLDGLLSNKALLGVGWADSAQEKYQQSLVPWLELRKRSVIDAAVQESLLAVPYAFGQIGAYKQSLQHYEEAIALYHRETERLTASIQAIRSGELTRNILRQDIGDEMGWFWHLKELPDAPESRYLVHLLASHDFQEAFKNYRDLRYLLHNLEEWSRNTGIYDDMMATRRRAYEERLPRVLESRRTLSLADLQSTREAYAREVARIEAENDATALATEGEQAQFSRLQRVEDQLSRFANRDDLQSARDKFRLLRGLLHWQVATDFKPRLWQAKKSLKELDQALDEAGRRRVALQRARAEAPKGFEGYDAHIKSLRQRLTQLQVRTVLVAREQERYLEDMAVAELELQQQRLATYTTQARFAVAQIYDRAAKQSGEGQ